MRYRDMNHTDRKENVRMLAEALSDIKPEEWKIRLFFLLHGLDDNDLMGTEWLVTLIDLVATGRYRTFKEIAEAIDTRAI